MMIKENLICTISLVAVLGAVCMMSSLLLKGSFAQSSAPYANCISMSMEGKAVQLSMDEDCNEQQFNEAMAYYKANGYPHESSYMDFGSGKFIELDSNKWIQDKADLEKYLEENK